ncbi:hypothetical protein ACFVIX_18690 [Bacillus subtilis]
MTKKELLHEKHAVSALSKGVILGCDSDEGTIYIIRKKPSKIQKHIQWL